MSARILIVGIGRPQFGDDNAGLLAAGLLAGRLAGTAHVVADATGGWNALLSPEPLDLLVVIDAAEASEGLPAGGWCRLRYPEDAGALAACRTCDTHSAGLAALLELAAALRNGAGKTWVYALGGEQFAPETEPSPAVAAALERLVRQVEEDVRGFQMRERVRKDPTQRSEDAEKRRK